MKRDAILITALSLLLCWATLSMAAESSYPTKPVEITLGASAGGGTDILARVIADKAKQMLGQEFAVVNKTGGGRVVVTLLDKSRPDGYALGAITDGCIVFTPHIEKINYKPLEYTFIAQYGTLDFGVFVLPNSPFKTFKDVMDWARANPGKLTMGVTEVNATNHVALLALCQREKIKMNFIPFMGANPTTMALLGGHVMVASTATSGFARHLKSNAVRLLCMMSDDRMDEFPDTPTLKELGWPDMIFQSWYLLIGPKNLDKAVAKKLEETARKAMESPEFVKTAKDMASFTKNPLYMDDLKKGLTERYNYNAKIIKDLGLKAP
jgi:tripartite-type tricarboxylate transporter receptor subunit TctC